MQRLPFYGTVGLHDPGTMRKEAGSYFIFGDGNGILGITSTDLRNWSSTTPVFPNGPPSWTTNSIPTGTPNYFWAPDTAYFNGLWHMYYAYSQFGTIDSVIGLATSPSLTNAVWTDQGKVIKSYDPATADTDTTAYNCIDPGIFVATNGTVWMSYGSYSSGIMVVQINPTTGMRLNTGSLGTQVANNAPGGGWGSTEEGSYIYQHGDYWYLFVNWGGCCDLTYSTYNIRVGRGASPTGPYYDRNGVNLNNGGGTMFLESTARFIGPGHAAISDDNGTNWFTYHFYDGLANGYPTVGCDQLYWSADGWPVMTNDWSVLYPLANNANESGGTYNGSLQGGAGFATDPVRGSVLNLNGTGNYVSLPLSVGNCSTVAAWVKWNGGAAWQRIFDFGNDTSDYFFLTPLSASGNMRCAINVGGGGEQQINAPAALPINSWHHVAVTLNGSSSTGILYLDGVPIATNTSVTYRPWQTTPHTNYIGKSEFSTDPYFSGEISSFRIFGRALSAAEISNIYSANPMLAHRYSFSTNGPAPVWDSIGMAHGTLMGNAVVTNNALELTGTGGYANLPPGLVSGSSALTLEFWATLGADGQWADVFDTGNIANNNAQNYFDFTPHNGSSAQEMDLNTTKRVLLTAGAALDAQTVYVAAICDPTSSYMAIYTNGVLEASETASLPALSSVSSAWTFIGRSLTASFPYLNASIDELRLYDGRLTPQQIAADYLGGPNVLSVPQSVVATNILFASGNGQLTLSWPTDHTGWRLQVQTNNSAIGLGTNWFTVPNSTSTNSMILPVGSANGGVFYRLIYP